MPFEGKRDRMSKVSTASDIIWFNRRRRRRRRVPDRDRDQDH
jgi:hypothetical protein